MVGEHETLRLHVAEDEDSAALAAALGTLPDLIKVSAADHEVVLIVPEAEEALAPVVTIANQAGFKIRSIDMHEANLETVFLHLTGRALRDQ